MKVNRKALTYILSAILAIGILTTVHIIHQRALSGEYRCTEDTTYIICDTLEDPETGFYAIYDGDDVLEVGTFALGDVIGPSDTAYDMAPESEYNELRSVSMIHYAKTRTVQITFESGETKEYKKR